MGFAGDSLWFPGRSLWSGFLGPSCGVLRLPVGFNHLGLLYFYFYGFVIVRFLTVVLCGDFELNGSVDSSV